MELSTSSKKIARFGLYEADLQQRVLTKGGLRVKLQEQPFQVLALLLESSGEVVSREEIRQKLWSADTYVEFDDGLNTAIKKLRTALSDAADNPRFIETIPRRGYRFVAPVAFQAPPDTDQSTTPTEAVTDSVLLAARERSRVVIEERKPTSTALVWGGAGLFLGLILTAGGYFYRARFEVNSHTRAADAGSYPAIRLRPSVAVIGFRNLTGRAESAWLSTAIAEMLNTEIAAGRKMRMVDGENIARTKRELSLADADTLAPDTLSRLRTNLDADYVVLGSYTSLGTEGKGGIRVDLRLQDASTGETIAEEGISGQEAQLFDLISQMGSRLRDKLGVGSLSEAEIATIRASFPSDPKAAQLYAQGLARLHAYDNLAARDLLLQAVQLKPSHALAHSALAACWKALGYDGRAQEEASKAYQLSKSLAREDQLWIEAFYRETGADWDQAIEIYRTLMQFFPDNLEYGLRLAETQSTAGRGKDSLATIHGLRQLPTPISRDPRIDLQEAYAGNQLGDYKQVQTASDQAAQKAEKRGARLLLARALLFESTAARNLQDPKGAWTLNEHAQQIYLKAGDTYGAARARIRLADLMFQRGEYAQSNEISEECLRTFRALGSKRDVANALDDIAGGLFEMGELGKARTTYEEALAVQKEVGNRRGIATELSNLGATLQQQGDLIAARKTAEETRDAFQAIGDKDNMAVALSNIAQILLLQGDLSGAKKASEEAISLQRALKNESGLAESLVDMGEILGDQGDVAGAQQNFDEALVIQVRREAEGAAALTRLGKAELLMESGGMREAEPLVRAALEQFKKEQQFSAEISAHDSLAQILLELGKPAEANSEIAQAQHLGNKSESRAERLKTEIVAARVFSASSPEASEKSLRSALQEADKAGLFVRKLEATLAMGEIEIKSGNKETGRARLRSLEKDAQANGFLLIAHKARTDLE
jgi:eukaryotic-like serine/threonine-protein kinase